MKLHWIWFVFPVILGLSQCRAPQKLSRADFSDLYSEKAFSSIRPMLYHAGDSLSILYLSINTYDFMQAVSRASGDTVVRFRVKWELYNSFSSTATTDSASFVYNDVKRIPEAPEMILNYDIKTSPKTNRVIKISLTDLSANKTVVGYCPVQRDDPHSRQYFLVTDTEGLPLFDDFAGSNSPFIIRYSGYHEDYLHVRYYNRQHPVALPPFAMEKNLLFRFAADSMFTISLDRNGESEPLSLTRPGMYHFQADTSTTAGLTMMRFYDGFPGITSPDQALYPLRYITSHQEFDMMLNYADHKTAVDSFWLQRASKDPVRARSMIFRYYSRVEKANRLFSVHKEGWKTDRGIIYIVYGPPTGVQIGEEEEEWLYGEPRNPLSIRFTFYKTENPFTDNDFRLQRSPAYRDSWYIAIENWRRRKK